MFDYHLHSTVSFDGQDSPERMLRAAQSAGLKEICFTDHIDDDPKGLCTNMRFTAEQYRLAYEKLDSPALLIRRGLEFGLLEDNTASAQQALSLYPFDFVIGSVHFAEGLDIYFPPFWEGKTVEQAERIHLETTLRCVQAHGEFDVLGHLTYISKARANPTRQIVDYDRHREIIDQILSTLARKGKGLEINTSGFDRCGDCLPPLKMVRRFKELGGEIVTVGSDAHSAERVGQYCTEVCQQLKEIFGYVCTFAERKPIFHKL